jgi:uncharacterized protein
MPEKIIRDPVHDVIAFRLEKPVDALLFKLINALEFQRLRRIRQLGMASLAYPGADHSRYSHSLGVMETARRMLQQLSRGEKIDEAAETLCVVGALLHDLGHGPFSHVFEHLTGQNHEAIALIILQDSQSQVHQILAAHDRQLPNMLADFLRCSPRRSFYCDLISSQLDADRFDYLLRDNLHTGSRYGDFDLEWLIHSLTVDRAGDRLAVTWKGVSAVEAYLQARYHMYRNVYFHKVVRTAEGMVKLAVQRASRLAVQDRLNWPQRDDPVHKSLLGQKLTPGEFVELDDVSIQQCLKQWAKGDDPVLARLCDGLLHRRLFKTIDITASPDPEKSVSDARRAVAAAGGDDAYDLFFDEPADTPYEIYDGRTGSDICVQHADGRISSFAEISPLTGALSRQLMFRRIHIAADYRDAVRKALAH